MRSFIRLLLVLTMSVLGVSSLAEADGATFYTVTYVEVIPIATMPAVALLRQYGDASRTAPGAVRVEVLQRIDRQNQFVLTAAWTEQKAFEAHQAGPSTAEFLAKLEPLLAAPNDLRQHQGLSVTATTATGAAGALYVATHVDVIPPRKDDAVVALKQLAEESRKEPGHVRFDVVQQTNRPNHFTVIEVWTDRHAFDVHAMATHAKRFRQQLGPMSGSLYDERLYQALR